MPLAAELLLALAAMLGHFALCVGTHNRIHAVPVPPRLMSVLTLLTFAFLAIVPPLLLAWWLFSWTWPLSLRIESFDYVPFGYLCVTWFIAAVLVPAWILNRLREGLPHPILSDHTERHPLKAADGTNMARGLATRTLMLVPGNQTMQLWAQTKELPVPDLPSAFDGLSITQLTDLHMLGHLTQEYYEQVIDITNGLGGDLIAVTGDIIEKPQCLDWLRPTLGRLSAPLGVYFIYGNHDWRMKEAGEARQRLVTECGLIDLGGEVLQPEIGAWLAERGTADSDNAAASVLSLAANELPWHGPASQFSGPRQPGELRVLLSHTPDNLPWAKANDVQLMLAGHTHGGQIRIPRLGPVVCPSHYGVKYAAGVFLEPPTLMHVCRGVGGEQAIRLNCAPEVSKLILRPGPQTKGQES
jgi:predicted MPP superfamily phosphohydrolase